MCAELNDYLARPDVVGTKVAEAARLANAFLWQIAKGKRPAPPVRCWAIEKATGGHVRRWHLRPADWHEIWPEIIGAKGAPSLQQEMRDVA